MSLGRRVALSGLAWVALTPLLVLADDAAPPVETVTVISVSAIPGTGIDIDKIPSNSQTLTGNDLARGGTPNLAGTLNERLGSISINDNLDNPFQPDILYRGFEASPVLGTPQGLAIYQNGVRINEAFGDAVNWDLFPDMAIARVDLLSSNPVYGLNALGGAVVVTMKNGFTAPGFDAELSGGSFGRHTEAFDDGVNSGGFGAFIAGRALNEGGWRQFSDNSLRQLYAALSAKTEQLSLDLSFTGANNRLLGVGATPIQELAVSRTLVFTSPQGNVNQLEFVSFNGAYGASDTMSTQATAYYREYRQTLSNGNTTNYTACGAAPVAGLLCQSDGATPLTNQAGGSIPDISQGGSIPIGENDVERIRTVGVGGSLQATSTAALLGHENHASLGATIDRATTDFQSSTELGTIDSALQISASGLFVATPENSPFNATPVSLSATNSSYGVFVTDSFDVTPELTVTASGRYNVAVIDLKDQEGSNLTGTNRYSRFNPALGLTDKILPNLTAYGGYAEGNRVPTASEIECANPFLPCLLPSSLSSDPPTLKQVVSHTFEAGLRGRFSVPAREDSTLSWNAGLFRTDLHDDIYGVATSLSAGYFQNIGGTRRQGADLGVTYHDDELSIFANYSFVDATFRSNFTLNSPSNPFQDANGDITVRPGDHLPGIPQHRLKAGIDYRLLEGWVIGGTMTLVSDQIYRGDESNQLAPLPGYVIVNLRSTYQLTDALLLFFTVNNLLDGHYATFGVLGDPTGIGVPGIPAGAVTNGPGIDNRFQSPAAPIAAYGGLKLHF